MENENTYNGWTNRATWLVNIHFNPENQGDLDFAKETIEEAEENLENAFLKDFIDLSEINWEELEEALES
ncbi:MAG: DUF7249 family protein [Candidatus Heimdallarchaeota archaeon]